MIHVDPALEPASFDARVRMPGLASLKKRKRRPPFEPYWTRALDHLMKAYSEICAYSCFRIHPVTGARSADHFAPKSRDWQHVYEWLNYRLCCARLNARKNDFEDVLDPFVIETGWFRLELVGFQVVPSPEVQPPLRREIQATVERLGLDEFRRERAKDAEQYWAHDVSLRFLRVESPFVAEELRRQGRLNAGDVW